MVGLGTYNVKEKDSMVRAILEADYRHLDTAVRYANEEFVGAAIKEALGKSEGRIKQKDLFVTTKIWQDQYNDPEAAIRGSLAKLGLDYVDLYLIHWPAGFFSTPLKVPMHHLWKDMESLVEKGLTRSIGVSNFNIQLLSDLLCYARIKPVCN